MLADPAVLRTLIEASLLDGMLNADGKTMWSDRRKAAGDLAKLKGFGGQSEKITRVAEQVKQIRKMLLAKTVEGEKVG